MLVLNIPRYTYSGDIQGRYPADFTYGKVGCEGLHLGIFLLSSTTSQSIPSTVERA